MKQVRCLSNEGAVSQLTVGKIYLVKEETLAEYLLEEVPTFRWARWRFETVDRLETTYCCQCIDRKSGQTGCFVVDPTSKPGAYRALSPVFSSLALLYNWMKQNNWKTDHQRVPWGCVRR